MNHLQKLHENFNQSPWVDNLSRELISSGKLQDYIDKGVRGLTSNPTIMENAITGSNAYDEQISLLMNDGLTAEQIYWKLVEDDIRAATTLLKPVWDASHGIDGYVSLEVSPELSDDALATAAQAKQLWEDLAIPNLMIKVPATDGSVPAIHELLQAGINVNVTLIFSLDHYRQVAEAHRSTHKLGHVNNARSVASFFISRVDNEIDARLTAIGTEKALNLRGQAAIAQAHLAYAIFLEQFGDAAVLEPESSAIQRLLWASTSTKNPDYDDLLYVKYLIAPHTVNTLPEPTIEKIIDHLGDDARSLSLDDIVHAQHIIRQIAEVGIDMEDVAKTL
ncbi:transaldolase, partial [Candidatus Saccharibacteria bacterium]|nr:transaldolase [Candidatus Saccharibacteria bacterium]